MFEHNFRENRENQIVIDDFEVEVVQEMLRFVYTGTMVRMDELAAECFLAADKVSRHLQDYKTQTQTIICRKDVDDVWLGWFITSDKDWISMPTCSKNDVSGAGYTLR